MPGARSAGRLLSLVLSFEQKKVRTPQPMQIELKKSLRSRRLRIAVYPDGRCVVTVPRFIPARFLQRFLKEREGWILEKQAAFKKKDLVIKKGGSRADYLKHKESARSIVAERILELNKPYGFTYGRVAIRNQKSRWGSCSKKGNLNFNYKIVHLSPAERDYIIVHELCHLGAFDHSEKFWQLVERAVPNHQAIRRTLRKQVFLDEVR